MRTNSASTWLAAMTIDVLGNEFPERTKHTMWPNLSRKWAKMVSRNAESMSSPPNSSAACQSDMCLVDGRGASHLSLQYQDTGLALELMVV